MAELNVRNRTLFHGDNLDFLRGLNSETVHLVATDPPFNKNKDFHATPDSPASSASFQDRWSWERDIHQEWVDSIKDDMPAVYEVIDAARAAAGEDTAAFLCFMGVRLIEMHRILKPTGSVYLHCDPTASHYLKALMDAVFGQQNFRNEIVWKRTSGRSDAKRFGRVHDIILFYTKSDKFTWHTQYIPHGSEYIRNTYKFDDNDGRGHWMSDQLTAPGHGKTEGEYFSAYRGIKPSSGRMWNLPMRGGMADWIESNVIPDWKSMKGVHERLDALDAVGLIQWPKKENGMPRLKRYYASTRGVAVEDIITDIKRLEGRSKEKTGYPTQKPLDLYERFIKSSSDEGDIVLDPFCGCATTPIAAERLGRRWIGMDIWEGAYDVVMQRIEDNKQLLTDPDPQIHYSTKPPVRTDEVETIAGFRTPFKFQPRREDWQKLTHPQMKAILIHAQSSTCGGCGRLLHERFLELDHIMPRVDGGANDISNRILLCRPCNGDKNANLTLRGLRQRIKADGWMDNEQSAQRAQDSAQSIYQWLRDGWPSPEVQQFLTNALTTKSH